MKRKTTILLSSIMASALLVGGVFAVSYAVTDNALPIGINVSPGDISTDDKTYLTLDWGQSTALNDVGNIKVGTNRKSGVVSLKSSVNYAGVFDVTVSQTAKAGESPSYLIDYLDVKVFKGDVDLNEGALPSGDPTLSLLHTTATTKSGDVLSRHSNVTVTGNPVGAEYTVFVTLDSSANPIFEAIQEDLVTIKVDWNAQTGDENTGSLIYATKPEGWSGLSLYSWTGDKANAQYPGVPMVKSYVDTNGNDVYQITVPSEYMTNLIFNCGDKDDNVHKTGDLKYTGQNETTYNSSSVSYFDISTGKWGAKPTAAAALEMSATVNGEAVTINDIKSATSENRAEYRLTLAVGDKVKFKNGTTDVHFYNSTSQLDEGVEFAATQAGSHTFYFNKDGKMYYSLPVAEKVYKVIGASGDWTFDHGVVLVKDANDENHYTASVTFGAEDSFKVWDGEQGDGHWFSNNHTYDNCGFTLTQDGNVKPNTAGAYTVNFYLVSSDGNHITIA